MALVRVRVAAEQAYAYWNPHCRDEDALYIYHELGAALEAAHTLEETELERQQRISGG